MKKESVEPTPTGGLSKMLTSSEVARLLAVAPSTLCRWRAEGKGPRVYWLGVASRATARTTCWSGSSG